MGHDSWVCLAPVTPISSLSLDDLVPDFVDTSSATFDDWVVRGGREQVSTLRPVVIFAVVYSSVASAPMGSAELRSLLSQSRDRNRRDGVSGMLLYRTGRFMQLLEGEEETVRTLVDTIVGDPRHTDVTTLWSTHREERLFPDWSMGFRDLTGQARAGLDGYVDIMDSPVTALDVTRTGSTGEELLHLFRLAGIDAP